MDESFKQYHALPGFCLPHSAGQFVARLSLQLARTQLSSIAYANRVVYYHIDTADGRTDSFQSTSSSGARRSSDNPALLSRSRSSLQSQSILGSSVCIYSNEHAQDPRRDTPGDADPLSRTTTDGVDRSRDDTHLCACWQTTGRKHCR